MLNQNINIQIYESGPLSDIMGQLIKQLADNLKIDEKEINPVASIKPDFGDFSISMHKFDLGEGQLNSCIGLLLDQLKDSGIKEIKLVGNYINFYFDKSINKNILQYILSNEDFASVNTFKDQKIMVEYSSPNTNKPLHLGHVRNNVLGMALANILEKNSAAVIKTSLINDRGIHICKSMWAYQQFGEGKTPQSEKIKGDLFVGNYYVLFEKEFNKEKNEYINNHNIDINSFNKIELEKFEKVFTHKSKIYSQAQEILQKWENNDEETIKLWEKMNRWVYQGFSTTYEKLGSEFDVEYYESQTYLNGKEIVLGFLSQGLITKKEDGSIGIKLDDGSFKVLLRSDGTCVYMTQDIGTAVKRSKEYDLDNTIYVVGDEQEFHFKTLFQILKKLNFKNAESLYHLSYGMIELPEGKMKSREGNVIDADNLIDELTNLAKDKITKKYQTNPEEIALSAIKYYILKSNAKTKLIFNPRRSLDFEGLTGPYLQYTYARINSIIKKVNTTEINVEYTLLKEPLEKEIICWLARYQEKLKESAVCLDPSILANYLGELATKFNHWYHYFSVANSENKLKTARLEFIKAVQEVLKDGLTAIGIKPLEKM